MINNRYEDSIGLRAELLENERYDHRSTLATEITLFNYDGDNLISAQRHRKNMTILSGRLSLLEKAFGIEPNKDQRILLSDMIPVPTLTPGTNGMADMLKMTKDSGYGAAESNNTIFGDAAKDGHRMFMDKVNYFCIGNGGENPTVPYEIIDCHNWETRLYNMVPFRLVPTTQDLSSEERKMYRMRVPVVVNGKHYIAYYAKLFDPKFVHSEKSGLNYIPDIKDSNRYIGSGEGHTMRGYESEVFVEFELDINNFEFKEYYKALNNNSLRGARLTELGLISAYEGEAPDTTTCREIYSPTLFSKLIHDPVFMTTDGSRRKVSYKIFA